MLANHTTKKLVRQIILPSMLITSFTFAEDAKTIGTMAQSVSSTFQALGQMIIGIAFVAGLGFGVAGSVLPGSTSTHTSSASGTTPPFATEPQPSPGAARCTFVTQCAAARAIA